MEPANDVVRLLAAAVYSTITSAQVRFYLFGSWIAGV